MKGERITMQKYETPELQVIAFEVEDVIDASDVGND